ncbi:hypothetical protein SLEP1_g32926 [Rubroshorea leprosula]|uniref:CCHC-type domain-containing protein n=1 Tax=Rubroshorea leprosula TaxID=152421 RepID=A0AAV5KF31_9ROSI|nr:hypothetical protein SLEP1_g32926 [Rubroshorea leprosula]
MMCNGEFLHKDLEEAIDYLNELAEKAHTWTGPSATDSTSRSRSLGIYQLKEEDNLRAQLKATSRELETLKMKNNRVTHTVERVEAQAPCFVCGGLDHLAQDCLTFGEMRGVYEEQCNALGMKSTFNLENIQGVNAITTRTGKVIEPLQKSSKLKDTTPSSREDDLLEEPKKEVPIRVPFPRALKIGKISNNQGTNLCQSDQGSMHHKKETPCQENCILDRTDTQSEVNSESKIPLILGRPFLATANALINCRNGLMKLSFGNMTLEVNIFHVGKQLYDDDECYQTYMIDSLVEEVYERENSESLEYLLGDSDLDDDFLNDHSNVSSISNARQDKRRKFLEPSFAELLYDRKHLKPFSMEMPPCEGLKHAFLGESSKLLDNG